jgi:hypothetical protein
MAILKKAVLEARLTAGRDRGLSSALGLRNRRSADKNEVKKGAK